MAARVGARWLSKAAMIDGLVDKLCPPAWPKPYCLNGCLRSGDETLSVDAFGCMAFSRRVPAVPLRIRLEFFDSRRNAQLTR